LITLEDKGILNDPLTGRELFGFLLRLFQTREKVLFRLHTHSVVVFLIKTNVVALLLPVLTSIRQFSVRRRREIVWLWRRHYFKRISAIFSSVNIRVYHDTVHLDKLVTLRVLSQRLNIVSILANEAGL